MFRPYRAFLFRPHRRGGGILGTVVGAALLVGMLAFGAIALLVIAAIGGAIWLARQVKQAAQHAQTGTPPPAPGAPAGVIEGEYVVVRDGPRVTQR